MKGKKGIIWPFWLELAFFMFAILQAAASVMPIRMVDLGAGSTFLDDVMSAAIFAEIVFGIPVGIVGLRKAKKMSRWSAGTRFFSGFNIAVSAIGIVAVLLLFVGAWFAVQSGA